MKIIVPGSLPETETMWPIGEEFVCPACTCRFVVEASDVGKRSGVQVLRPKCPNCPAEMHCNCPTCGCAQSFKEPLRLP